MKEGTYDLWLAWKCLKGLLSFGNQELKLMIERTSGSSSYIRLWHLFVHEIPLCTTEDQVESHNFSTHLMEFVHVHCPEGLYTLDTHDLSLYLQWLWVLFFCFFFLYACFCLLSYFTVVISVQINFFFFLFMHKVYGGWWLEHVEYMARDGTWG